jgi:tubulin monoglycylase TTLL3/8
MQKLIVKNENVAWMDYRKKHKLDKKTKIFVCQQYSHFKKALLARGWHENKSRKSEVFDLKMMVKREDIYKDEAPLHDF